MSNTLTALARTSFGAIQEARRNAGGLIQASTTDFDVTPIPLGEAVDVPVPGAAAANSDANPGATSGTGSDTAVTTNKVTLTKRRRNTFAATGEDAKIIDRIGFAAWYGGRLQRSMLALIDEMEADLAALYNKASYAIGTPGTVPFGSSWAETADLYRLAIEAGIPVDDLNLVINPLAAANLRKLSGLTEVAKAGTDATLRNAELLQLNKWKIRESSQLKLHTKGAASGYLTNGAAITAGTIALPVDTGTLAFVEGDSLSIAGDTAQRYMATGNVSGGNLPLRAGLKNAVADNAAITTANYTAHMAFHRRALALAVRPTALPPGGDAATEQALVVDPVTKLTFLVLRYGQYLQASYEVHATWGAACIEPEALFLITG